MFKTLFDTPFEQYARLHGQPFTVVRGPLDADAKKVITLEQMRQMMDDGGDQPTFLIRFESGEEIHAHPEEVLSEFTWSYNPNQPEAIK